MNDPTASRDTPAERDRVAGDHLSRVNGPGELRAAILALLLPAADDRGSERALLVWQHETSDVPTAMSLLEHVERLSAPARLPWFEQLVSRLARQPLATRQQLLASTRRLMSAPGSVRPIDRLHWLAMRRRLGELALFGSSATDGADVEELPETDVHAIAGFCAFLARMIPGDALGGPAWYASVMVPWQPRGLVPPCHAPDSDGVVHALQQIQGLAFMHRPVLLRGWVTAAIRHSRGGRLLDGAADALRLTGALLDCPLPPELSRHFPPQKP